MASLPSVTVSNKTTYSHSHRVHGVHHHKAHHHRGHGGHHPASASAASLAASEPYELSQDLILRHIEVLENKYGGTQVAKSAATTIQRAFRREDKLTPEEHKSGLKLILGTPAFTFA